MVNTGLGQGRRFNEIRERPYAYCLGERTSTGRGIVKTQEGREDIISN